MELYGYVSSLEGTLDAVLAGGPENVETYKVQQLVYPHRDSVGACVQRCIS